MTFDNQVEKMNQALEKHCLNLAANKQPNERMLKQHIQRESMHDIAEQLKTVQTEKHGEYLRF